MCWGWGERVIYSIRSRSARRTPEIGVSFFREGDAWKQVPGFAPE